MDTTFLKFLAPNQLEEFFGAECDYWNGRLHSGLQWAGIPGNLRTGASSGATTADIVIPIDDLLLDPLSRLSRNSPALCFVVLVSACLLCLRRCIPAEVVAVAAPVPRTDRDAARLDEAALLHHRFDDDCRVGAYQEAIRETVVGAFDHARLSLEHVIALRDVRLWPPQSKTYPVLVALERYNTPSAALTSNYDLTIVLRTDGQAQLSLRYNAELYSRALLKAVARMLVRTLEGLCSDPTACLSEIGHATPAEATAAAGSEGDLAPKPVTSLVDAIRDRDGDSEAVRCGETRYTYREFVETSDAIAHQLVRRGVRTGDRVAVLADHAPETVAALFGIMRAGAAFVPLDPSHPQARLQSSLDDARPTLTLVDESTAHTAEALGYNVVYLSEIARSDTGGMPDLPPPPPPPPPEAIAYVMYTSGTSGRPKGVAVPHRALSTYALWSAERYLTASDRNMGLFTSPAFDLTLTSIFAPLVSGGRVVIYNAGRAVERLLAAVDADEVEAIKITPSQLALLQERPLASARLRCLIVGGEQLSPELAADIHDAFDGRVDIVNEYGPTEATVGCIHHSFDRQNDRARSVPIGRPIPGAEVYLVDATGRPVADGAIGEICIGGVPLAHGYLDRCAATAERYRPSPFGPGRLYHTGDLGRRDSSGKIECFGRLDSQMKLLGVRVEPEEITAALSLFPGVETCAVRLRRAETGKLDLLAYYTSDTEITEDALDRFMRTQVLKECVPRHFVRVAALPISANGKLDFDALPDPPEPATLSGGGRPPSSEAEIAMAEIWSRCFNKPVQNADSDFFSFGGDSVLALRITAHVKDAFGVEFSLKTLLELRSLAAMAAHVAASRPAAAPTDSLTPQGDANRLDKVSDEDLEAMAAALRDELARKGTV